MDVEQLDFQGQLIFPQFAKHHQLFSGRNVETILNHHPPIGQFVQ
jgi:hypothetical protein